MPLANVRLLIGTLLVALSADIIADAPSVTRVHRWWIESPDDAAFELSGLAHCDGKLYAVSDKHSPLFSLPTVHGKDTLVPVASAPGPTTAPTSLSHLHWLDRAARKLFYWWDGNYDWEGLTCYDDRPIMLSERFDALYDPVEGRWLESAPKMARSGRDLRLNRSSEGIVFSPSTSEFWWGIEREPAVLMQGDSEVWRSSAPDQDVADLALGPNDTIWMLHRNGYELCEFNTTTCIDLNLLKEPDLEYAERIYGVAEAAVFVDNGDLLFLGLDPSGLKPLNFNALHSSKSISQLIELKVNYAVDSAR